MEYLKIKVPKDYTYFHVESNSQEDVFRIREVRNAEEADEWIKLLSDENKTTWRIGKTYPRAGLKNLYRKDYRCQHLTDKRTKGSKGSKNTNCPAKLHLSIQRYIEKSKAAYNPRILKDYPTEVVLKGTHNHPIISAESLRYRDMSEETKHKLTSFFMEGHTPSSALHSLKVELMCEYPDDYSKVAADSSYLPSISVVYKLFKKVFKDGTGDFKGKKIYPDLEELAEKFNNNSEGITHYQRTADGKNCFIVVITSLMMRCHREIKRCCDTVLLDSSVGIDKHRHRAYIFATPTTAGGLPLGIIITDCEKEDILTEALFCYKGLLSDNAFYSKGHPNIFLTNNYMKERNSLKKVFPDSSVLLCQFHILKSIWSWLCFKKNNIDPNHRQNFYFLFKRVVYSYEEDEAETNATDFIEEARNLGYTNLCDHFMFLWEIKNDWISCYRKELLTQYSELECSDNTLLFEKVMHDQITSEEQLEFESLIGRIKDRLSSNPNAFVPAFRKMLENAKTFASTDSGLVSAMCMFGTQASTHSVLEDDIKVEMEVGEEVECHTTPSPVAAVFDREFNGSREKLTQQLIARRRSLLSRQKKLNLNRRVSKVMPPQLEQHDYTSFGTLPKRKRKAQTNLERCVLDNKSFGAFQNPVNRRSKSRSAAKEMQLEVKSEILDSSDRIIVLLNFDDADHILS